MPPEIGASLPEAAKSVLPMFASMYEKTSYVLPWIGYVACEDGTAIGTCAFKSPPIAGRVEIAYFTFPGFERRGYATQMAQHLIELARAASRSVLIVAQTLPEENASTRVLKKLGMSLQGTVQHPEDGPVWEWHL